MPKFAASSGLGLTKEQRICQKQEIQQVLSKGCKIAGSFVVLYCLKTECSSSRLAIIVSRRNIRFAVKRNRVKRVVREFFRQQPKNTSTYDIVIIARKAANTAKNNEITLCLEKIFHGLP